MILFALTSTGTILTNKSTHVVPEKWQEVTLDVGNTYNVSLLNHGSLGRGKLPPVCRGCTGFVNYGRYLRNKPTQGTKVLSEVWFMSHVTREKLQANTGWVSKCIKHHLLPRKKIQKQGAIGEYPNRLRGGSARFFGSHWSWYALKGWTGNSSTSHGGKGPGAVTGSVVVFVSWTFGYHDG